MTKNRAFLVYGTYRTLQELCGLGHTICLSLHDIGFAKRFSTHTIVLQHGRVFGSGLTSQVLRAGTIEKVFAVATREIRLENGEIAIVLG